MAFLSLSIFNLFISYFTYFLFLDCLHLSFEFYYYIWLSFFYLIVFLQLIFLFTLITKKIYMKFVSLMLYFNYFILR